MPQTNYLPLYTASYPLLAKVQKPGGVTVATTVGAGDVPNKPTYVAGTIQIVNLMVEEEPSKDLDEKSVPKVEAKVEPKVEPKVEHKVEHKVEVDDSKGKPTRR
jgi:hypothetical protein